MTGRPFGPLLTFRLVGTRGKVSDAGIVFQKWKQSYVSITYGLDLWGRLCMKRNFFSAMRVRRIVRKTVCPLCGAASYGKTVFIAMQVRSKMRKKRSRVSAPARAEKNKKRGDGRSSDFAIYECANDHSAGKRKETFRFLHDFPIHA